jgi:hypothetical protein
LYAVLLLENELPSIGEAEQRLAIAEPDPSASAPAAYGRGLLALHQNKADVAREEFRRTWEYDAHADSLYPRATEFKVETTSSPEEKQGENSQEKVNAGRHR